MLKYTKKIEGMSYLEIIVCLVIVSMMVLPLSASFVSSTRMREEGVDLTQITFTTERLMEEVKEQLRVDLKDAYLLETTGNTGATYAYYLDPGIGNKYEIHWLSDFFRSKPSTYVETTYDINRYEYEVAIWPLENYPGGAVIEMASVGSEPAFKLHTSTTDAALAFHYSTEDKKKLPKLDPLLSGQQLFGEKLYLSATDFDGNPLSKINGMVTLRLEKETSASPKILKMGLTYQNLIITPMNLKTSSGQIGYKIKLNTSIPGRVEPNLMLIDTRLISSYEDMQIKATCLEIENASKAPLWIKLIGRKDEWDKLDEMLHILIEDKELIGKTTLEKVIVTHTNRSYLIGIVVRDKKPVMGESGKIVKTMMDLLTYEPNERE
ncbi:hypothetical protein CS063_02375 [Sporanaerobium hydrogeniformans]|uniref:Uncharacterized protein n=1 Tax=Sporanaerobium hydrogeniformans TaxID=3072179 RepID=A0AC61DHS8_9FIRM|nr:hypothetical protein [Sporanaerobium hydrogeniformans]PHV72343.1 hypothetical protein CS063_02375 [Sporanaerobium hydrogeniformans]